MSKKMAELLKIIGDSIPEGTTHNDLANVLVHMLAYEYYVCSRHIDINEFKKNICLSFDGHFQWVLETQKEMSENDPA